MSCSSLDFFILQLQYVLERYSVTIEGFLFDCFSFHNYIVSGRCSGLMVSAFNSELSSLGSSLGQGHCVVFLGKTLYSHSALLHPGVKMVLVNLVLRVTM